MLFIDMFLCFSDDTAEFNQVNAALISIFKMDAKGKVSLPWEKAVKLTIYQGLFVLN